MSRQPRVSVCVPTFNQGRFLARTLESVLRQTVQDFEIVVCDDASTDDTPDVVASFREPRLRYLRNPSNLGIAENRDRCLAEARGEYIAWLDSDDVYLPEMLAVQSAVLDRHPAVGLVHGAYQVIGPDGERLPDWPLPFAEDVVERGIEAFGELILANYITAPTVLVRREAHDRAGPYASRIGRSSTDWDMWLRIALRADVAYTSTPVAQYRQHGQSISSSTTRSGERLRCDAAVVEGIFSAHRQWIPEADAHERRARAALAAKALLQCREAFLLGRPREAVAAARLAGRAGCPGAEALEYDWIVPALVRGDEYGAYRLSRILLAALHGELHGTRYGERIRKVAVPSPEWEAVLEKIALAVRSVVPQRARIAAIDKWDPTLLHLSGREGWHFPDLQRLPEGYPRDSGDALDHLEEMRARGAEYLVVPSSAFWWLDHYGGLRDHLEKHCHRMWGDERCLIFALSADAPARRQEGSGLPAALPLRVGAP